MRDKQIVAERNVKIYSKYCELWGQGMRDDVILEQLSSTFYLKNKTLEDIIRAQRTLSFLN